MSLFPSALPFLSLLIALTLSCAPPLSRRSSKDNSTLAGEIIGTDPPQPPSTYGYAINHVALQVSNITETRAFWGDVLGMRFIFSFSVANTATKGTKLVTYMGYPYGDGKVGDQTGAELLSNLHKRDGLMEFLSGDEITRESIRSETRGFSHVGLAVPNITATQERLESYNVNILKPVGQQATDNIDVIFGFEKGQPEHNLPAVFDQLFDGYMIVTDPDGYGIEIFPA